MVMAQSLLGRFRSGVAWNSVGTLALQGGTFVTNLIAANLLGAHNYGQYGMVINTAQTLGGVLQLSTGMAATKYLAQHRGGDKTLASQALGLCSYVSRITGIGGTIILAALSSVIAHSVLNAGQLAPEILIAAPIVLFSILTGFQVGALAGLEGFRNVASALMPLMALQVGSIAAAAAEFGLLGAVISMTVNLGLRAIVCHRLLLSEARKQGIYPKYVRSDFSKEMFYKFLLPGSLTGLTTMPAMWLTSVTLAKSPGGFEQVAYFNAAYSIRTILMIFPWILNTVGLSLLSHHLGSNNRRQFGNILLLSLGITFSAVMIGAGGVLLMSERLLRAYGHDFTRGKYILEILMLSLTAEALALPLYQALASYGKMWRTFFWIMLPRDLILLLFGIYWIHMFSATGLAWAYSVAWLYALLISAAFVWYEQTRPHD